MSSLGVGGLGGGMPLACSLFETKVVFHYIIMSIDCVVGRMSTPLSEIIKYKKTFITRLYYTMRPSYHNNKKVSYPNITITSEIIVDSLI